MRVVVSLTTIHGRRRLLEQTLESLSRQSVLPDAVYLWLPADYDVCGLPPVDSPLLAQSAQDLGPATKLLPTLLVETDPETRIITVDDDVVYPPDLIERLTTASDLLPRSALGFTGWHLSDGSANPGAVQHLNEDVSECAMYQPVHVLEGYRGVLYRRGFFGAEIFQHLHKLAAFRTHDDILISGYLALRGIGRTVAWYSCSAQEPAGHSWRLLGDNSGLHTRLDWLESGRRCASYWTEIDHDVWSPIPPTEKKANRLQLNAHCGGRRLGFTHHGPIACDVDVDVRHDLSVRPWPWGDNSLAEVLAIHCVGEPDPDVFIWLSECHRVLRPGGIVKIRTTARSSVLDGSLLDWDWTSDRAGEEWISTLVKKAAP